MHPLIILAAAATAAGHTPAETAASLELADPELRVELVAAEPLVESPCALAFDEKGRIFVAENRGYPNTAEPPQGRIALLTDDDGDGRVDRRTTFADGLTFPNGVLPWRDGLIVTCAPDVLFLRDGNGDGTADERRVLLTGFATSGSTQLRVNAPTPGPDGWIYFAAGLSGGEITAPGGSAPPVKMTGDLRWHPGTGAIENVDGRSQYGMAFDAHGNRFICMNRIQVQHVVLDSRWLRRNPHLALTGTVQNCPELVPNTLMRSTAGAARLFPISSNVTTADSHQGFFSAACAVHIWRGGALPARYDGHAFSCDPTANVVHLDRLVSAGASFAATPFFEKKEFLASRDDWFRPVFLARGPEGALYVCDMSRRTIEHPEYLPDAVRKRTDFETGKNLGRIWRITGRGRTGVPPARPAAETAMLPEELNHAWNTGDAAGRARVLRRWLENEPARAWKPDPSVLANDPAPEVRFAAALALGEIPEGIPALAAIAARDAADPWTRAAVLSSIAGREAEFLTEFLAVTETVTEGTCEILETAGRGFKNITALLDGMSGVTGIPRSDIPVVFTTLFAAVASRSGEVISPEYGEGIKSLFEGISSAVVDKQRREFERVPLVRFLGHSAWRDAGEALLAAAHDASEPVSLAAIRALAKFPEGAPTLLADFSRKTPAQRETIIASLLAAPASFPAILDAIEAGKLPAAAISSLRRPAFQKHGDAAIRERAAKVFSAVAGDRRKAFEDAKMALSLAGDGAAGRGIFGNLCASCHRLDRVGHAVGPDLFDIRGQTKENILFHIVVPDAEVAPAFTTCVVETKDGRTFSGILAGETPAAITLRGPLAQETTIVRGDIAKLETLPNSLMPPALEAALTVQQLADLLAALKGE